MHRFCLPGGYAPGDQVCFPADEAAHAIRVLRLRAGEAVEVFTGTGARFAATLVEADKAQVLARIEQELPNAEPPVRVTLYQGLPKADKLDFIAQKITELGACRLAPVAMSRSVVKLDEKEAAKRAERLSRIALEAAKQCGRGSVPQILPAMSWKQTLCALREHELVLMPWEDARGYAMREAWKAHPQVRDIALVIGPEGGISEQEAREVQALSGEVVTLGPRILRTETAAVTSVALAMNLWGDL